MDDLEALILEVVRQNHSTHCTVVALIHMLVDRGVLKGNEEDLFRELQRRSHDIEREELTETSVRERARTLLEAWNKLPKQ